MDLASSFKVGFIARTHGLKGEVTLLLDDYAPDLETGSVLYVTHDHELVPYFVERSTLHGNKAFVKLEDVDTVDVAAALVKRSVYLPKSVRPKLESGAFYDDEIIDFAVVDALLGRLGTVKSVLAVGPNKMLAVDDGTREVLIPTNGPFVTRIDPGKRTIHVDLPDGFLSV